MNKKLYLGIYAGSFALAILGVVIATAVGALARGSSSTIVDAIAAVSVFAVFQFLLVLTIYPFVLLAKMWGSIQDKWTTVTPGKAIGFLFIPFFNLYWIFKVWAGYAGEYDNYALRHDLDLAPLESYSFTLYPIFAVLGGLLYFPMVILPFLLFPMISKACDAVNGLSNARVVVWVR
jgi:hypothetical protein